MCTQFACYLQRLVEARLRDDSGEGGGVGPGARGHGGLLRPDHVPHVLPTPARHVKVVLVQALHDLLLGAAREGGR